MSADSNITSLLQREHHESLAGIGVGCEKVALGARIALYRALSCIRQNLQRRRAVSLR